MKITTLDIYLNKIVLNIAPDGNDSAVCNYVSSLSYHTAGNAIYLAAAIIGKEIHPQQQVSRLANPKQETEIKNTDDVGIFPNPAKAKFNFTGPIEHIQSLDLLSTDGRLIKHFAKQQNGNYTIENITPGFYNLRINEQSGKTIVLKLSIVR